MGHGKSYREKGGESKRYMRLFRVIPSEVVVDIYNKYYAIRNSST